MPVSTLAFPGRLLVSIQPNRAETFSAEMHALITATVIATSCFHHFNVMHLMYDSVQKP